MFENVFYANYNNSFSFRDLTDKTMRFIEDFQLLDPKRWQRFVQQFREQADNDLAWRGEYWGKMMRGACLVYSYTKNKQLYNILTQTVKDMMDSADADGRISTYSKETEADGWDMWCRKYVLLGMQYFLEICTDDTFSKEIISSMCKQTDCILDIIGDESHGKKPITKATQYWRGLNSSSILEPIVRLYTLTKEEKYLQFATYIVECGGTEIADIFTLAYEDHFYPYQYPMTKAYEMISCFEGLLAYYRVTGIERYKTAVVNFADKLLESDFTIIGGSGCTHELFDHSTVRQANTTNGALMQETCVTVTLMKFFYQMLLLTGESKFADAFETSFFNAYLGAVNTEKVINPTIQKEHPDWFLEPLPFDSYSPLTAGTRGNGVGGLQVMSDNHYYGCCACIGAAGIGLVPKVALLSTKTGLAYQLFIDGKIKTTTPAGNTVLLETVTHFPKTGNVTLWVDVAEEETFELLIRIPAWSQCTDIKVSGTNIPVTEKYTTIYRNWTGRTEIEIKLDMRTKVIQPIPYKEQILMNKVIGDPFYVVPNFDIEDPKAKHHIALKRGPVILAQDSRLGYDLEEPVDMIVGDDGVVNASLPPKDTAPYEHLVEMNVPLKNGGFMTVTDYASAGKLWTKESKIAAWILTNKQFRCMT